jgi:hypothetical protein
LKRPNLVRRPVCRVLEKAIYFLNVYLIKTCRLPMRHPILVDEDSADAFVKVVPFKHFCGYLQLHLQALLQIEQGASMQLPMHQP